jgi:hypothetical protein
MYRLPLYHFRNVLHHLWLSGGDDAKVVREIDVVTASFRVQMVTGNQRVRLLLWHMEARRSKARPAHQSYGIVTVVVFEGALSVPTESTLLTM